MAFVINYPYSQHTHRRNQVNTTKTESDGMAINGRCYCGDVQFSTIPGTRPIIAGYCHCRDCRQAHAAPVYQFVYLDASRFEIVSGYDLLNSYVRDDSRRDRFKRYFYMRCGTRIYNYWFYERNNQNRILSGTFPSLFDNQEVAMSSRWSPKNTCIVQRQLWICRCSRMVYRDTECKRWISSTMIFNAAVSSTRPM